MATKTLLKLDQPKPKKVIGASLSEPHIDWHNGPRGGECINLSICHGVAFVLFNSYGEAHTVVLYARPTRAAIARPRDCTFFHNYLTFFHNSTAKWTTRRFAFPSRFSMNHDAPGALISDTATDAAARTKALARRGSADSVNLKRDTLRHHCYLAHIIPRCIYSPLQIIEQTDFHTFVKGLTKDCLQKLKNIGYSY